MGAAAGAAGAATTTTRTTAKERTAAAAAVAAAAMMATRTATSLHCFYHVHCSRRGPADRLIRRASSRRENSSSGLTGAISALQTVSRTSSSTICQVAKSARPLGLRSRTPPTRRRGARGNAQPYRGQPARRRGPQARAAARTSKPRTLPQPSRGDLTTARPAPHFLASRAITELTALPVLQKGEESAIEMTAATTTTRATTKVTTTVGTMLTVGATSAASARASTAFTGAIKPTAPNVHSGSPRQALARLLVAFPRRVLVRRPLARRAALA